MKWFVTKKGRMHRWVKEPPWLGVWYLDTRTKEFTNYMRSYRRFLLFVWYINRDNLPYKSLMYSKAELNGYIYLYIHWAFPWYMYLLRNYGRKFPSSLVVSTLLFHFGGMGLIPDPGGKILWKWKWKWKWSRSVVSDSLRPVDCSPPSSSIHGILQARILE